MRFVGEACVVTGALEDPASTIVATSSNAGTLLYLYRLTVGTVGFVTH